MLTKEDKDKIIKEFQSHSQDTGSPEIQIALLTNRIKYLTEHFKQNPKDHHSRHGLIKLIVQRKRLLEYLGKKSPERYQKIKEKLGI